MTRCPACGTTFKVVSEQLRISEGWVRCGHCSEIFDASANIARAGELFPQPPRRHRDNAPSPREEPAPQERPEAVLSEWAREVAVQVDNRAPTQMDLLDDEAPANVTFVQEAQRKAFWSSPPVRWAFGIGAMVLALALVLQVVRHERNRLAAAQPSLRPALEALCQPLRCDVGPARQIESLVIDGSSFNKVRGDAYRLSVTLRNQGPAPVATPAVELTLTDSQDQAVLRRVLFPTDLGAQPTLPAGGEWSTALTVAVLGSATAARVAGYRVFAFYP